MHVYILCTCSFYFMACTYVCVFSLFSLSPSLSLSLVGDGKKLASIGLDDDHSIVVWNWKKGEKLATARAHKDKLFMIKWNPLNENQLLTVGIKHIKFWNQVGES